MLMGALMNPAEVAITTNKMMVLTNKMMFLTLRQVLEAAKTQATSMIGSCSSDDEGPGIAEAEAAAAAAGSVTAGQFIEWLINAACAACKCDASADGSTSPDTDSAGARASRLACAPLQQDNCSRMNTMRSLVKADLLCLIQEELARCGKMHRHVDLVGVIE
jgi:hypothetical protein